MLALENSKVSIEPGRVSHKSRYGILKSGNDGNPSFEFEDQHFYDPDLLAAQKEQDLRDIQRLENKIKLMTSRLTIKEINDLTAIGLSLNGSQNFE